MNYSKINALLGMKERERLSGTPHHKGYNLLEHGLVVGMLFRWFASEEDIAYDINVFDKVLLHDIAESVTGDCPYHVKNFDSKSSYLWDQLESHICGQDPFLRNYTDSAIRETLTPLQFKLFKICDYLDLWIFCKQELALGNSSNKLVSVIENCEKLISSISEGGFKSVKKFMEKYEA